MPWWALILKQIRAQQGLTVRQFAATACVSPSFVMAWYAGTRTISAYTLARVCRRLGHDLIIVPRDNRPPRPFLWELLWSYRTVASVEQELDEYDCELEIVEHVH